jgi:hypothetical protein
METIIFDGELTIPPNSYHCSRDLLFFLKLWKAYETILIRVEQDSLDFYYDWLKRNYFFDHVDGIIHFEEKEEGLIVGYKDPYHYRIEKINEYNYTQELTNLTQSL